MKKLEWLAERAGRLAAVVINAADPFVVPLLFGAAVGLFITRHQMDAIWVLGLALYLQQLLHNARERKMDLQLNEVMGWLAKLSEHGGALLIRVERPRNREKGEQDMPPFPLPDLYKQEHKPRKEELN